jgi:tRNA(Ile)-lysidine synthase
MGPDPAVAAVRVRVRGVLGGLEPGSAVLVACSGGADSLALAGALAFEAARSGHRAGGLSVDHGLQEGSAERARTVVRTLEGLGLAPAETLTVQVGVRGGPEAAARQARYEALGEAAARLDATVLLGHTLDDQAETVLLGLARGSGARSLAGMPASKGPYRRPLLDLDRATVRRACLAMGLEPWDDPHNDDPSYARVRVRHEALPVLERVLGPGIARALARSAAQLRADADALDDLAERYLAGQDVRDITTEGLAELPGAVRTRVLRRLAVAAGSPPGALAAVHIDEVDRLVTAWHGQLHVDLPGGVRAYRRCGRLLFGSG